MRALLLLSALSLLACGGGASMGEACDASEDCAEGGACLKGVCSGYACGADADCENGHVCGDVAGVPACVLPCDDDVACAGDQACHQDGFCL